MPPSTSNHRKQVAVSLLRCANPTAFRREFHTAYGAICPDGKVSPRSATPALPSAIAPALSGPSARRPAALTG